MSRSICAAFAVLTALTTACSAAPAERGAPLKMPENASRVTARVLAHAVHPPGSITTGPPVRPSAILHSYSLDISTVAPAQPDAISLAKPGIIEAFSLNPLVPDLVGREISATVTLTGDNRGVRWFLSDIHSQ